MSACSRRWSKRARPALLLSLALLVTGCVSQRGISLPDISDWDRRVQVLSATDEFSFAGRIAVNTGSDGFNGKLRWNQAGEHFDASVSGPLGIGTVRLAGNGRAVDVTDKDGVTTRLQDVENDLYRRYGWTIPVESLRFWTLGIPDPRVPAETAFSPGGELSSLVQRGWTVEISRYRQITGGQAMPSRLTAQNPEASVRLVIDRWTFR